MILLFHDQESLDAESLVKSHDEEHRNIWIWAMEKNIANIFESKRHLIVKNLCTELLTYDKENKLALDIAAKTDALLEEEQKAAK